MGKEQVRGSCRSTERRVNGRRGQKRFYRGSHPRSSQIRRNIWTAWGRGSGEGAALGHGVLGAGTLAETEALTAEEAEGQSGATDGALAMEWARWLSQVGILEWQLWQQDADRKNTWRTPGSIQEADKKRDPPSQSQPKARCYFNRNKRAEFINYKTHGFKHALKSSRKCIKDGAFSAQEINQMQTLKFMDWTSWRYSG